MEDRLRLFLDGVFGDAFVSATLSAPRGHAAPDAPHKVLIRPVVVRDERLFQFERYVGAKALHENLRADEASARVRSLLAETFRQGHFRTTTTETQVIGSKIKTRAVENAPSPNAAAHNRRKNYLLPEGEPIPFLVRLGVMTKDGRVVAAKYDKFRQINRFVEMVADIYDDLPAEGTLRVVDFGSGKSYLTFALHHYLTVVRERSVEIVGLDRKADVIAHCAAIATDLNSVGLRFTTGEIASAEGAAADLVVALHACDTATDDALAQAVAWGAKVILAVPCCQHELFSKIDSDVLRPLLRHGILKERLAALVTDALRAQVLERAGYAVQILEFIDLEHTPKNLLLRATRRRKNKPAGDDAVLDRFLEFWNLENPHIEAAFSALPTSP